MHPDMSTQDEEHNLTSFFQNKGSHEGNQNLSWLPGAQGTCGLGRCDRAFLHAKNLKKGDENAYDRSRF